MGKQFRINEITSRFHSLYMDMVLPLPSCVRVQRYSLGEAYNGIHS